ncbi:DUF2147 domain-containing protein [Sphingorhabdus sp. IMCC26285]|jgi:uncharacterized protein (DUF2147 family)|uniref:DUF2147 domain-containing protein n=1 Tax=Sphingorhabdus profundilacus TaxID=2509718 RepID=A0A6I4LZ85_9SPHN|nr:DUF2147 domain-containing protein [Sphingorhabdus profundilacus]MVZ97376.1 DUF2147 domain-containing protein [Sphingorhabdus profundilacus]
MFYRKLSTACIALGLLSASAHAAAPVTGRWVTQSKDGVVEIYECGATICGKLAKFLVPPPNGIGQKDINNPNKTLRGRTLLGMDILTGFKEAGNEWKGQIYDPKSGKTYRSVIYKGKSGNLVVKGCIGPFCQAQSWAPAR